MSSYTPLENEKLFELKPIGVAYRCEFCHEGEQEVVKNEAVVVPLVDVHINGPIMRRHRCNKCGKEMSLPKSYPYIEWVREDLP